MRCIDKAGGIDDYLLSTPSHELDSDVALKWKLRIREALGHVTDDTAQKQSGTRE